MNIGTSRTRVIITAALAILGTLGCDTSTAPERATRQSPAPKAPPTSCPGYAPPEGCRPFPASAGNLVTGSVFERTPGGTRAGPGARVWAWVQLADGNGYSAGGVDVGVGGKYRFTGLPDAFVVLQAGAIGYNQPCASTVQLTASNGAQTTIELVSDTAPIFDPAPPAPGLRGVVFEMTPDGRRPVAGAKVFVETLYEIVAATTMTDEQGRYSFCRLPLTGTWVTPLKEGYVIKGTDVALAGVVTLDLEMSRK